MIIIKDYFNLEVLNTFDSQEDLEHFLFNIDEKEIYDLAILYTKYYANILAHFESIIYILEGCNINYSMWKKYYLEYVCLKVFADSIGKYELKVFIFLLAKRLLDARVSCKSQLEQDHLDNFIKYIKIDLNPFSKLKLLKA